MYVKRSHSRWYAGSYLHGKETCIYCKRSPCRCILLSGKSEDNCINRSCNSIAGDKHNAYVCLDEKVIGSKTTWQVFEYCCDLASTINKAWCDICGRQPFLQWQHEKHVLIDWHRLNIITKYDKSMWMIKERGLIVCRIYICQRVGAGWNYLKRENYALYSFFPQSLFSPNMRAVLVKQPGKWSTMVTIASPHCLFQVTPNNFTLANTPRLLPMTPNFWSR